jgi:sensor c-di-GMP phosphodiesterase-like protein
MNRTRVIVYGIVMAIIGAILPIALMAQFSWTQAVSAEQKHLTELADRTIRRAKLSFDQAVSALRQMEDLGLLPCSRAHINAMRRLTMNVRPIEEIGYFNDNLLRCTSWGVTETDISRARVDYMTPDGVEVTISLRPSVTRGDPMMAIQVGAHNALVNKARFTDLIIDDVIQLAITRDDGTPISDLNGPAPDTVRDMLRGRASGVTPTHLYAWSSHDGWTALAIQPRSAMQENLRREQSMLIPIGAFISLFIVALVFRLSRERLSPLAELQIAVKKREFVVHYQPMVDLRNGTCVGAEALVRWRRPDGTMVRPDMFIPLAEESGLILPITDQVIDTVVRDLSAMLAQDRAMHVAINLSAEDVRSGRVLPVLSKALEHTGIQNQQVWLEATERGFMDIASARATVAKARAMGHCAALDDFGTGYSSLQFLQGLQLDALKIDKSFVDTIGKESASKAVVSHIIDMARTLDLLIVAEGVETQAQADYLREHGVAMAQGWHYAKAMPLDEFLAFYQQSRLQHGAPASHA